MGKQVLEHELSCKNIKNLFNEKNEKAEKAGLIKIYENDNFFAPMASGAFKHDGMVVCPCSITTLSKIASGIADNLICRASDVCLKERLPLILLVRETPLNAIHLQNMYKLSLTGAIIMPASPGFYFHPNSINDLVGSLIGKILNLLKIKNDISKQWGNIY